MNAVRVAAVLVTCEHASNRIPPALARQLRVSSQRRQGHEGYDLGAAMVAGRLSTHLHAPLVAGEISRLVVDLNRSPHNPRIFSDVTRPLSPELRADLLRRYHRPHWRAVERRLARMRAKGSVLHLGVHSFAPVLRGQVRTMDVGLLYDPGRAFERRAVGALRAALQRRAPQLVVRRNAPYRGVADGLTSALRKVHSDAAYAGIELEINNRWLSPTPDAMMVAAVLAAVADALERLRRG